MDSDRRDFALRDLKNVGCGKTLCVGVAESLYSLI